MTRAIHIIAEFAVVQAAVLLMACHSFRQESDPVPDNGDESIDERVNREVIDAQLDSLYLWNEAYRETTHDMNQSYDKYLKDVLSQMYRAGVNLQDGYKSGNNWHFYTYITREAASGSATRADDKKEKVLGLGMSVRPVHFDNSSRVYLIVEYVIPDSPAKSAGIERGDVIGKINGVQVTQNNYGSYSSIYYDEFESSTKYSFSILQSLAADGTPSYGSAVEVTTDYHYATPVVLWRIYKIKGHSVGWIVYTGFKTGYDEDLQKVFDRFREERVTDIIFDLRYNGGGDVESCCKTASILAGGDCAGEVFLYYRYNAERMRKRKCNVNDYRTYNRRMFDTELARKYGFDFEKIHIVGTSATASASELLVNSLRGVGKRVVVVACENTNGKDVGMEIYKPVKSYDGYRYTLAPISFQCYNARGESDYDDGFAPDLRPAVDYEGYVPSPWGLSYNRKTKEIELNDYLADALMDIAGTFTADDVEVVSPEGGSDTRAGGLCGLAEREGVAIGMRNIEPAFDRGGNIFKNNMYEIVAEER